MTLASTRPILKLTEIFMNKIANLLGGSLTAWWLSILTLGPLLGSYITEPAAMTISALLLARKFYALEPSTKFKYATLGLLFVNISVGGTVTHFAAPPVLMVAEPWGWGMAYMLRAFGWKAALGIISANLLYCLAFRNEFAALKERFIFRTLKEEILTKHLSREVMESAIDMIAADVRDEGGYREKLTGLIEEFTAKVRTRLENQYLQSFGSLDIDPDLASKAFQKRFDEIKLCRMRREFPNLLSMDHAGTIYRSDLGSPRRSRAFVDDDLSWPVHVMGWTIFNAHHPELFIPGMLFFLGFAVVTADYQNTIDLKPALLVGFFLGGLATHGGVQGWWIEPVLGSLAELPLMAMATVLTTRPSLT